MQLAPGGRLLLRELRRPVVVVARELTPSETAHLDPEKVLAFVTEAGGRTSHAAIMARSMGVPAVAGVSRITDRVRSGSLIAVDGTSGQVAVNPDERTIKFFETQKALFAELERRGITLAAVDGPNVSGLFPKLDIITNPDLFYIRFHGRNAKGWRSGNMQKQFDYDYGDDDLRRLVDGWIAAMARQASSGVIFFNNHVRAQAPRNARQLLNLLTERGLIST